MNGVFEARVVEGGFSVVGEVVALDLTELSLWLGEKSGDVDLIVVGGENGLLVL